MGKAVDTILLCGGNEEEMRRSARSRMESNIVG